MYAYLLLTYTRGVVYTRLQSKAMEVMAQYQYELEQSRLRQQHLEEQLARQADLINKLQVSINTSTAPND